MRWAGGSTASLASLAVSGTDLRYNNRAIVAPTQSAFTLWWSDFWVVSEECDAATRTYTVKTYREQATLHLHSHNLWSLNPVILRWVWFIGRVPPFVACVSSCLSAHTPLLWLHLTVSKLMIASVFSSWKDQLPTGSKRNTFYSIPRHWLCWQRTEPLHIPLI